MALTEVCKGRDNSHSTGKKSETEKVSNIQNSSISNSINSSSSSNKSTSTRSGATSISGVKTYQQLKKELFDWFKISRGPTLQKISQDDLFESAILFFRNSRIQNPEAKIERDRVLLDQIIDDINSNRYFERFKLSWRDKSFNQSFRAGTTHNTLEASSDVHDLLAGCSYVSPNLIPLEIRQKPAPAKHRNLEQRFKVNSKCKNLYNFTDYLG